jgi:pyruvate/2-oxoglutarate dehydrogenase complex dihydrolipoamide dehydrogenase (E3) component
VGAPRVTFTEPQVAAVGLTERAAREAGFDVEVVAVATSASAGGMFWGRAAEGTSQLVIDARRRVILGATFTGVAVQDMLHAATFAIVGELRIEQLRNAIAPFPTRSEVWLNLLRPPTYRSGSLASSRRPLRTTASRRHRRLGRPASWRRIAGDLRRHD